MTNLNEPGGDYLASTPGRKKLSRGRKALIGLLVAGAIGAVANTGTFASFTASTDNASADDAFTSDNNMKLGNTVLTPGSNTQCNSANDGTFVGTPVAGLTNAVECEVLFTATQVAELSEGAEIVSDVVLENLSDEDQAGILRLAGVPGTGTATTTACTDDAGTAPGDLCDNVVLTIQEFAEDVTGDATRDTTTARNTDFTGLIPVDDEDPQCAFPRDLTQDCASTDAADQLLTQLPITFDANSILDSNFPASSTQPATNTGVRFFRITASLVGDDLNCVTIDPATGEGCFNGATGDARFTLRWVLQSA